MRLAVDAVVEAHEMSDMSTLWGHHARVVVRDPEQTEMVVQGSGPARAFAKQLMKKGKAFRVAPSEDGRTWTFLVEEINWPTRWEDH